MNRYLKLLSVLFISFVFCGFVISATTPDHSHIKSYENISFIKAWLKKREVCSVFLREEKILPDQYVNVAKCYMDAVSQYVNILKDDFDKRDDLVNFIADRVLTLNLPEKLLTKMVEKTANGSAVYTEIIKQLVEKGASISNIQAYQIRENGFWSDKECETIEFITEKNKGLHKSDIYELTYTGGHHSVCVTAVERLIEHNPEIINQQDTSGDTPLHKILFSVGMGIYPKLALKLMSKTNVNLKNNKGNTALHQLILNSGFRSGELSKYQEVIDEFVELGGNLDLKNSDGITVRELLVKYSLKI